MEICAVWDELPVPSVAFPKPQPQFTVKPSVKLLMRLGSQLVDD